MVEVLIGWLASTLALGIWIWREDTKAKRVSRQVALVLPNVSSPNIHSEQSSLRNQQERRSYHWIKEVFGYSACGSPIWGLAAGAGALIATTVVGRMLDRALIGALVGLVVGALAVRSVFCWQRERYANRLLRQLPDTVELVVSAVRAGLPVVEAFRGIAHEMPAPTKDQFVLVNNEIALGRPFDEAVRGIYNRTRVAEYAIFSVTLAVQSKSGGRLAETLEVLGDTIRERVGLAGRARALAAEANLSARVMSSLPFLCGIALYFESPRNITTFFTDRRAQMLLALAIILLSTGVLSMRRMIRKGTEI